MPKYTVDIDLSGMWSTNIIADSREEAIQLAIEEFEEAGCESILACIEPVHPTLDDIAVWLRRGG